MLNVGKAWEITKGQGVLVVVSDQGFHIKHPALIDSIKATEHFGPKTLDDSFQNFHGTDMSRILLSVAPKCKIITVLCSGSSSNRDELAGNIAKSFDYAVEHKADVITSSWAGFFGENKQVVDTAQKAVDKGVVLSWFHFPKAYPGLLRSRFTYSGWGDTQCIGFADRFLTDEPGFHPVEIEAGLSETAPQAAGLAVLVKSVNSQLKPAEIQKLIFDNSTPIGNNIVIPDAYKIVVAAKETIKNVD
jgi:subtilisin family serine protease